MRTSQDYQRCPAIISVSYVFKRVPCAHVQSGYFRSWTASVVGRIGAPMPSMRTAQTGQPRHLMLFPVHTFVPHASAISVAATIDTRRPFSRTQW